MKKLFISLLIVVSLPSLFFAQEKPVISEETQACIECHETVTPGIVGDWHSSLHSRTNLSEAFSKNQNERRISVASLPEGEATNKIVGCYECHSLNAKDHKDNFEHFGYKINVVVSPNDCKTCHPVEVEQYSHSKKAYAPDNLSKNPVYSLLVESVIGNTEYKEGAFHMSPSSYASKMDACYACHGTSVEVTGIKKIDTDLGEIEVPALSNWPNQGVGRINPDGSRGACTSCHPRHSFSIEIARRPYTCGQCHLEPDVPAYNVYKESKHGNIYESKEHDWNFNSVPWVVGKDFDAPTCATCHNSLLTNNSGDVIAERTHDFGSRLWVRIFGLIYSHPQPKNGFTYDIVNDDKLPLPTSFAGKPAGKYLIDEAEQKSRQDKMESVCKSCHSTEWVESNFEKFHKTNELADKMVAAATNIMAEAWNAKIENKENPFDEQMEKMWQRQWLFYANSVRYGSAMMGPDYTAFKNGWWSLQETLRAMKDLSGLKSPGK